MKRYFGFFALIFMLSCASTEKSSSSVKRNGLTAKETTEGLVEALLVSADVSSEKASTKDGFFKNAAIKILFPPEVKMVRDGAIASGMRPLVDRFELSMNRAAEDAAKEAKPILVDAIKRIKFKDVWKILFGGKTAATDHLRLKTETELVAAFAPIVKKSIAREEVTKHWKPLADTYNLLPVFPKVNPDLEAYVTQKTVDGLFKLIADEEQRIRENPIARVSDILRKVFGNKQS